MAIVNPTVFGAGGMTAYLVVSVDKGSTITATNGSAIVRAQMGDKPVKMKLTKAGDWTVTATLGDKTAKPQIVTVPEEYPVTLRFIPVLKKDDKILSIVEARISLGATSIGNYALFGGGQVPGAYTYTATVTAFDQSLTRISPTPFGEARSGKAATAVGNYAIFDGLDVYDKSLTHSLLDSPSVRAAATTVGTRALFYGNDGLIAYDQSLTRITPAALAQARGDLAVTSVGGYALFGGGYIERSGTYSNANIVDAYDESLTRTTPTALSLARTSLAATTVGEYALFGGGYDIDTSKVDRCFSVVDAYDQSLARTTPTALSKARSGMAATAVQGYALFGGGLSDSSTISPIVDAYNQSLIRTTPPPLNTGRSLSSATTIGTYALFGGGQEAIGYLLNTVDVYTVE